MTSKQLHFNPSTIANVLNSPQENRLNNEANWLFPATKIERRWHPAGCQTCAVLDNLWESMGEQERKEWLWQRHKKHHYKAKPPYALISKNEFIKEIQDERDKI